jgi:hypothetical protein
MKINILEKLTLQGKSAWAKVITITPLILLGVIYTIFGLLSDNNPVIAEKGLLWGLLPLISLPINYFLIFFKWFKV